ncbi:MAG: Rrf2 family transcriptional regulator [Anaerolineae bacterium]|nr:Rrf2 family transcriptional regulator [Anaerolineae bacterium]
MRLSQKGEYGLHALLELARHHGEGPVQASEVAARRQVPAQYLQQILLTLRHAGLVHSERGPRGGHILARRPEEITLLEAVEALEGSSAPAPCTSPEAACAQRDRCVLRPVLQQVDAATRTILSTTTLADLARQEEERESAPMYHI